MARKGPGDGWDQINRHEKEQTAENARATLE